MVLISGLMRMGALEIGSKGGKLFCLQCLSQGM